MRGLTSPTSLFVSTLPLRVRFSLVVAAIVAGVIGALWWLSLRVGERQGEATFWFALSGILLVTLLVDQAARLLVYRRLARMRETMQQAAAGQLNARVPIDGLDEIGVIARGLNDILQGLERLNEAVDVRVEAATEVFRQKSVEIADSHREMAMLSEELARAGRLAALGQAAANMAHQIGTPLNLISTYVQLLIQSTPPEADSIDRLKAIQDQVAKVTAVVRAALDSSRPPAIPHERADLGALVRRVCQMAGPMLEDAGVQIEVMTPDQSSGTPDRPGAARAGASQSHHQQRRRDGIRRNTDGSPRARERSAPSRDRRHRQWDSARAAGSHLRPVGDHKGARQRIRLGVEHRPTGRRQPRGNDPRGESAGQGSGFHDRPPGGPGDTSAFGHRSCREFSSLTTTATRVGSSRKCSPRRGGNSSSRLNLTGRSTSRAPSRSTWSSATST